MLGLSYVCDKASKIQFFSGGLCSGKMEKDLICSDLGGSTFISISIHMYNEFWKMARILTSKWGGKEFRDHVVKSYVL